MAKTSFCAMEIILFMIVPFLEFSSSQSSRDTRLLKDISQLASALPGCYNNARQYYAYSTAKTVPHQKRKNIFFLRVEFYRLQSPLFNDSLTIYFQDYTKSSKIPFSSGFYSFTPDHKSGTIRMKVYTFLEAVPGLRVSYSNYSIPAESREAQQLTAAVSGSKLKTYDSCDMVWKKTSLRSFRGVTRPDCLANMGQESVRISVSITLTESRITLTEGWYNLGNRARLRELKIPYILKRNANSHERALRTNELPSPQSQPLSEKQTPTILTSRQGNVDLNLNSYHSIPITSRKIRGHLRKTHHELNSLKEELYSRVNAQTNAAEKSNVSHLKDRRRRRNKRRILRKYRHVKASLTAGQRVFYRIDLSKCKKAAIPIPISRLSFGGEITNFQIIREERNKKRRTKIYFSNSGTSISSRGVETMLREMTLYRGGHVEVKVTKQTHGNRNLKRQYTFQCKLFNRKRRGSVKIFNDQRPPPKDAKSLKRLTGSVEQGHNLWLVADVSKCRGKQTETTVTAGGLIADYDIVNGGKTLQLFLRVDQVTSEPSHSNYTSGFVINIFKNNDVILTWVNTSNENTPVQRKSRFRPAYHCELSNQMSSSTSNEAGNGSVKVFIR